MTRTIAIANQKGGVGKTTTAVNLAAAIAMSGRRALLVDLDAQANATSGIGAALAASDAPHPLYGSQVTRPEPHATAVDRLSILPSSPVLVALEHELSRHADGKFRLAAYLRDNSPGADFVVVDCPPSLGLLTTNALNAATRVLVPIQCEYFAMEGLTRILEALNEVRSSTNTELQLAGILLTMFDPDLDLCNEVVSEVRGYFGEQVYDVVIPRDVALSEAASYGVPVFQYNPRGPGALAYLALAREVMANG